MERSVDEGVTGTFDPEKFAEELTELCKRHGVVIESDSNYHTIEVSVRPPIQYALRHWPAHRVWTLREIK